MRSSFVAPAVFVVVMVNLAACLIAVHAGDLGMPGNAATRPVAAFGNAGTAEKAPAPPIIAPMLEPKRR